MDRRESLSALAEFTRETGIRIALPPHATVLNVNIESWVAATANKLSVTLDVYEVTETVRELRFVRHGKRMMIWTDVSDEVHADPTAEYDVKGVTGRFYKCMSMTLWDDDFVPFIEHRVGKIETPAEYAARRRWEGEQYRVGTSRNPMDSASRVTEGYSPMSDYWNR
jgi:hypothetical protein